jgi:pilus assembly protein CpaB
LIAVFLVRTYLTGSQKAGPQSATAGTSVIVAAVPIARGAALQPTMFKVANYPSDSVPAGSFRTQAQLSGAHLALRSIALNEPIMAEKVSGMGAKTGLSASLDAGMRAVSLRSNDVAGVAGFALPGDRVDVMLTRTIGNGGNAPITVTQVLAENVRVLGVDQSDNVEDGKPVVSKAMTVEVTPDQAQSIQLAQAIGTVAVSLRQLADNAAVIHRATTTVDLGLFGAHPNAPTGAGASPTLAGGKSNSKPRLPPGMTEVRVTRGVEMTGYPVAMN